MKKALATEFIFGAAEREKIMFIDRRNEDRSHTMTDKSVKTSRLEVAT
jgi:hypothetical protein